MPVPPTHQEFDMHLNPSLANGSERTKNAASAVSEEFHHFLSDIEDLVKQTTTLTGEDLARARAKLSERVSAARESVEEMGDSVVKRVRQGAADTNAYVHEEPWKAIGVGALVGLLLGVVLARRN